ncbi:MULTISPECIES: hypothetical protein [Cyanophyceae]|nr:MULTISPECIES: hypothetical protein [Cyanophyceae]MBD1916695.1 hypothetical protein [Phormidium sp. FACHB-77]MBD2031765.1 hypothetical protein [Phormidium sp. FACHB-322]MBD2050515.1 hypothetical protein [Leptolyngbya sp. FACHB-60]
MADPNSSKRNPSASEKNVLKIDVPTLMVILTALILLPLLVTGFISQ